MKKIIVLVVLVVLIALFADEALAHPRAKVSMWVGPEWDRHMVVKVIPARPGPYPPWVVQILEEYLPPPPPGMWIGHPPPPHRPPPPPLW